MMYISHGVGIEFSNQIFNDYKMFLRRKLNFKESFDNVTRTISGFSWIINIYINS